MPVLDNRASAVMVGPGRRLENRLAFTLIELLVVIAVIALLAGMLFPVFSQAKGRAIQAKCVSNLKQLGTAMVMYTDDWKGVYPYPGGNTATAAWDQDTNGGLDYYLKNKTSADSVWRCPKASIPSATANTADLRYNSRGRSYAMNDYLRPYNKGRNYWPLYGLPVAQVESPSRTILLFETVQDPGGGFMYSYRNGSPDFKDRTGGEPTCWHGDTMNVVFCDGHVLSVHPAETFSGTTPSGSTRIGMVRLKPSFSVLPTTVQGRFPGPLPDMWMPFTSYERYPSQ